LNREAKNPLLSDFFTSIELGEAGCGGKFEAPSTGEVEAGEATTTSPIFLAPEGERGEAGW